MNKIKFTDRFIQLCSDCTSDDRFNNYEAENVDFITNLHMETSNGYTLTDEEKRKVDSIILKKFVA